MLLFSRQDKILDILMTRNIVSIIVLNIGAIQYNIKINLAI